MLKPGRARQGGHQMMQGWILRALGGLLAGRAKSWCSSHVGNRSCSSQNGAGMNVMERPYGVYSKLSPELVLVVLLHCYP